MTTRGDANDSPDPWTIDLTDGECASRRRRIAEAEAAGAVQEAFLVQAEEETATLSLNSTG